LEDKKSMSSLSGLPEATVVDETKQKAFGKRNVLNKMFTKIELIQCSDDPTPLIAPPRISGESPPKVIKRKAPSPITDDSIAISRPVGVEIKPLEGALPPPPISVKKAEVKTI
jgi:hypothetical protein